MPGAGSLALLVGGVLSTSVPLVLRSIGLGGSVLVVALALVALAALTVLAAVMRPRSRGWYLFDLPDV